MKAGPSLVRPLARQGFEIANYGDRAHGALTGNARRLAPSHRIHLGLNKDVPDSQLVEITGKIFAEPVLGGLHHRYRRV